MRVIVLVVVVVVVVVVVAVAVAVVGGYVDIVLVLLSSTSKMQ